MIDDNKPRLGRGLAALLGEAAPEETPAAAERNRGVRKLPVAFIKPNPKNPRKTFNDEGLEELANSIREKGVIQPVVVRAVAGTPDVFELISGERRWRAAQRAAVHEIPAIIIEASDRDVLELAIIENVQRADLNPFEEAQGYEQLAAEFGYSQSDLARIIGKSRSHIANTLRLLKLPDYTRSLLVDGSLSAGHGRALLALNNPDSIAKQIVEQGLSVRDVERLAQTSSDKPTSAKSKDKDKPEKDADTRALEKTLSDALGLIVQIAHRGEKGEVTIRYKTFEQLDLLCHRLTAVEK